MKIVTQLEYNKYPVIYLNLAWPYKHRVQQVIADTEDSERDFIKKIEIMERLPVNDILLREGEESFYVFMWVPWAKLRDGAHIRLLNSWNLKWRNEIIWNKIRVGQGRLVRKQTEVLILATEKGKKINDFLSVMETDVVSIPPPSDKNTLQKPPYFKNLIENNCVSRGPYLEISNLYYSDDGFDDWDFFSFDNRR